LLIGCYVVSEMVCCSDDVAKVGGEEENRKVKRIKGGFLMINGGVNFIEQNIILIFPANIYILLIKLYEK
jgi:hypothetical protein